MATSKTSNKTAVHGTTAAAEILEQLPDTVTEPTSNPTPADDQGDTNPTPNTVPDDADKLTKETPLVTIVAFIVPRLTRSAEEAWQIGRALSLAKLTVKEAGGSWCDWLAENFTMAERTAQRYVRVGSLPRDAVYGQKLGTLYGDKKKGKKGKGVKTYQERIDSLEDDTLKALATDAGIVDADEVALRAFLQKVIEAVK